MKSREALVVLIKPLTWPAGIRYLLAGGLLFPIWWLLDYAQGVWDRDDLLLILLVLVGLLSLAVILLAYELSFISAIIAAAYWLITWVAGWSSVGFLATAVIAVVLVSAVVLGWMIDSVLRVVLDLRRQWELMEKKWSHVEDIGSRVRHIEDQVKDLNSKVRHQDQWRSPAPRNEQPPR